MGSLLGSLLSPLCFEYETPKIVNIRSKRIGCLNRVLQLLIVGYVVGFAVVWQKGYQVYCDVDSAVTTKVKGVMYTKHRNSSLYNRVWDPVDYVFPAYGGDAGGFFVATNVVITEGQVRGVCPESPSVATCKDDSDCPEGGSSPVGNGLFTGSCVVHSSNVTTCEVRAWCPVEDENALAMLGDQPPLLLSSYNSTVLIKNVIEFPLFGPQFKRRNVLEDSNATYLSSCLYDPVTDPFCPVFKLGSIVEMAGENYTAVALRGAVFQIGIHWECNLDWAFLEWCTPQYRFERMDRKDALISPGWNFRSAEYHEENRRSLFKNYGIKFIVKVSGRAGKFNAVPLLINLGSGLALLGLAGFFCDLLVLHCNRNRTYYKDKKYLIVSGHDAFTGMGRRASLDADQQEQDRVRLVPDLVE